jgi:hypothetical protein
MKRNLQLTKLADFNKPGKKHHPDNDDFEADSFLEWFDDSEIKISLTDCKSTYMFGKTYIEKIVETRIVCLGNYSLVKACNIVHPFWVLSYKLESWTSHDKQCECNQIPPNTKRLGDYHDEILCSKNPKIEANKSFAKNINKRAKGDILYLDSDTMFTTKMLIAKKVMGTKYPVNFDEYVVNDMLRTNSNLDVIPQFGTMSQLITDFSSRLKAVWFDYCGRFDGSKVCNPKSDILQLFQSNRLTNRSTLGFTFTLRDYTPGSFKKKRQNIMKWIQGCAKQHNYHLTKIKMLVYHSMLFVLYHCEKKI